MIGLGVFLLLDVELALWVAPKCSIEELRVLVHQFEQLLTLFFGKVRLGGDDIVDGRGGVIGRLDLDSTSSKGFNSNGVNTEQVTETVRVLKKIGSVKRNFAVEPTASEIRTANIDSG